jgi:hypothetical protein
MRIREIKDLLKPEKTIKIKRRTKVETFDSFNEALQLLRKETKTDKKKPQRRIKKSRKSKNNRN